MGVWARASSKNRRDHTHTHTDTNSKPNASTCTIYDVPTRDFHDRQTHTINATSNVSLVASVYASVFGRVPMVVSMSVCVCVCVCVCVREGGCGCFCVCVGVGAAVCAHLVIRRPTRCQFDRAALRLRGRSVRAQSVYTLPGSNWRPSACEAET